MSRPFFITGLPRSRTAWLSVVATNERAICYHEPGECDFPSAAFLWTQPCTIPFIGIADAGLGMHLTRILAEIRPRVLIVDRPIMDVLESARRFSGKDVAPDLEERLIALHDALQVSHPFILRVDYNQLQDETVVRDALAWLTPGVRPWNLPQLMHMNIQSDLGYNVVKRRACA